MPRSHKGLVSIVVPVYNAEEHLTATLNCLERQTYNKIEILLIDDGSKDTSAAICESFARRDCRFQYVEQENAGAGAARNNGLDRASGEFLMFLDADDLFEADFVERLVLAIKKNESDVAVCMADWFKDGAKDVERSPLNKGLSVKKGTFSPCDFSADFFQAVTSHPWDKLYRAAHIRSQGLRYQNLRFSNDSYFVLMAMLTSSRITWIEDVLVHYRVGQGTSLRDKMYLSPLCDLRKFDALRLEISTREEAELPGLMASLDAYTVNTLFASYAFLASQSESACAEFRKHFVQVSLPKWMSCSGTSLNLASAKLKFKYWCLTRVSPKGMAWAVSPYGRNGLRTADKKTWLNVYARLIPARFMGLLDNSE